MINQLPIAIAFFILLNYLDQTIQLGLQKNYVVYIVSFILHVILCVFYSKQMSKREQNLISKLEIKVLLSSVILDPLWLAEIFKKQVEFQSLGSFGLFLIINSLLFENSILFSVGTLIFALYNPILAILFTFLFFFALTNTQRLKLLILSLISIFGQKFYGYFNIDIAQQSKNEEFWLYYKLSNTKFSPYYSLIGISLIIIVLLFRNNKISRIKNLIYKLSLISIILKSMSFYKFDACMLQVIFYSLTLINKNLFFIPIYSSFVFLVVYPKIYKSRKIGVVIAASYVLFVGVLSMMSKFYKNQIFRQQKILTFLFFCLPITIVVFSFFGSNIVLLILQESFELFYLLLIFILICVFYFISKDDLDDSFNQNSLTQSILGSDLYQ